jgi:glycerol-1-phosphate dehydrogenase [NAD(P)+]
MPIQPSHKYPSFTSRMPTVAAGGPAWPDSRTPPPFSAHHQESSVSSFATLSDPTDLDAVRSALAAADPDQRLAPLGMQRLAIGQRAADQVADEVADQLRRRGQDPLGARVVLLVDNREILRRGDGAGSGPVDLKHHVARVLAGTFDVRTTVLDDGHATLHATDDVLDAATAAVTGADGVVAVGGGTISDIAKVAAGRAGDPALVTVQTAASVDGYTDGVSVVLRDGVKRTIPSRWPDVVLADQDTIVVAPPVMNEAGFGEVLSMFTGPADWYLASIVGLDPTFHPGPPAMLAAIGRDIAGWSPGVGRRESAAIGRLTEVLALRGIATGVSDTTAVLSGMEHVVSHLIDMHNNARHLPTGQHGAQVGVASIIGAVCWELLDERLVPDQVDLDALFPDPESLRDKVFAAFGHLDADGRLAGECWKDYHRKMTGWARAREQVAGVLADWDSHRATLSGLKLSSEVLGRSLVLSGAPARFADLDPAVDTDLARWAVSNCHLMRNRFTVADLLDLLGWWTPADVDEVMARAERATTLEPVRVLS